MVTSAQSSESSVDAGMADVTKINLKGRPRGFAAMEPSVQRRIASEGGRAAHASGNAHQFTPAEARAAGSKSRSGKGMKKDLPSGTGQ